MATLKSTTALEAQSAEKPEEIALAKRVADLAQEIAMSAACTLPDMPVWQTDAEFAYICQIQRMGALADALLDVLGNTPVRGSVAEWLVISGGAI